MGKISFKQEVVNLMDPLAGNPIDICIQCGTCSGSCPAMDYMTYSPRQIVEMVRANLKEEVITSDTIWYCASCYHCTVRCPKGINITRMMYALKRYTVWNHSYKKGTISPNFSKAFAKSVLETGKSFEPILALTFIFKYGIRGLIDNIIFALALFSKGRLPLVPSKIKRIKEFRRILNRIVPVGE